MEVKKDTKVSNILSYIGKRFKYDITRYYDGHPKKIKGLTGTCVGIDNRPRGKPEGIYLIIRVDSTSSIQNFYHTIALAETQRIGEEHHNIPPEELEMINT